MLCVVAPLLHTQLTPALAVRVTLPPAQIACGPLGLMVATGSGLTVTSTAALSRLWQPLMSVTRTVWRPPLVTLMLSMFAPLLQTQLTPALAVRVTLPPAQIACGPLGLMVATGSGFTVTSTAALSRLCQPFISVTRSV